MIEGRVYRRPSISTDEWLEKNSSLMKRKANGRGKPDESEDRMHWRTLPKVLLDQLCQEFTRLVLAQTNFVDGKRRKKMNIKLPHVLELACGAMPKQQFRDDLRTWTISCPNYFASQRQPT